MAFQVVHPQHRNVQRRAQRTGHAGADQQRARQAGAARVGHHIHGVQMFTGFVQHGLRQRQHAADMVAAGKLRHHAAIGLVHVDLAVQGMGQQPRHAAALDTHQGHAGFVTGRFDAQDQLTHARECSGAPQHLGCGGLCGITRRG